MIADWQPIESAPKDGRDILLFYPAPREAYDEDRIQVGSWYDGTEFDGAVGWVSAYGIEAGEPTHWLPLPPAPHQISSKDDILQKREERNTK